MPNKNSIFTKINKTQICFLSLILLFFLFGHFLRTGEGWSGRNFNVKIKQYKVGYPFNWVVYTSKISIKGTPPELSTLPDFHKYSKCDPGLEIKYFNFLLSILIALVLSIIVLAIKKITHDNIPKLLPFPKKKVILVFFIISILMGLFNIDNIIIISILIIPLCIIIVNWKNKSYNTVVILLFISFISMVRGVIINRQIYQLSYYRTVSMPWRFAEEVFMVFVVYLIILLLFNLCHRFIVYRFKKGKNKKELNNLNEVEPRERQEETNDEIGEEKET